MKLLFIIIALTCMLMCPQRQTKTWQSIEPLVTTRAEVDLLLGKPTSGTAYNLGYDTEDEHFTVWFGGGNPNKDDPCQWKLKTDVVFLYVVSPKRELQVGQSKIDLTTLKKERDPESDRAFYYFDEINGTTISTRLRGGVEYIESIRRGPKLADRQKYCPSSTKRSGPR